MVRRFFALWARNGIANARRRHCGRISARPGPWMERCGLIFSSLLLGCAVLMLETHAFRLHSLALWGSLAIAIASALAIWAWQARFISILSGTAQRFDLHDDLGDSPCSAGATAKERSPVRPLAFWWPAT